VNKNRPVNLDLSTVKFPITAIVSILHRISGVITLGGVIILMWLLDASLASEESFLSLQEHLANPLVQFIVWAVLAALGYHLVMGTRHLIMDMGIGETLEGGRLGAKLAIFAAVVVILGAGWIVLW